MGALSNVKGRARFACAVALGAVALASSLAISTAAASSHAKSVAAGPAVVSHAAEVSFVKRLHLHRFFVLEAVRGSRKLARIAVLGPGIRVVHSQYSPGMCIGVAGASMSVGAAVKEGWCNGSSDQEWNQQAACGTPANPCWTMINVHSHLCLDFQGDGFYNGDKIIQYWCNSGDQAQQLGMESANGPNCPFTIHHWSIWSVYMAAVPAPAGYEYPTDLVEWEWGSFTSDPTNAQFYNSPPNC